MLATETRRPGLKPRHLLKKWGIVVYVCISSARLIGDKRGSLDLVGQPAVRAAVWTGSKRPCLKNMGWKVMGETSKADPWPPKKFYCKHMHTCNVYIHTQGGVHTHAQKAEEKEKSGDVLYMWYALTYQ